MALVNCNECGAKVSTNADKCPHCGNPQFFLKQEPVDNSSYPTPQKPSTSSSLHNEGKERIVNSLINFWGLEISDKSQWKSGLIFWSSALLLIFLLFYFAIHSFDKITDRKDFDQNRQSQLISTQGKDSSPIDPRIKFDQIKLKHFKRQIVIWKKD
jgi:hypothetical protein